MKDGNGLLNRESFFLIVFLITISQRKIVSVPFCFYYFCPAARRSREFFVFAFSNCRGVSETEIELNRLLVMG